MKRSIFLIALIVVPILIIVLVNENYNQPTKEYNQGKCTRYCHNRGCKHFEKAKVEKSISPLVVSIYRQNIHWLRENPLGLSYKEMNLLIYVLISPALIVLLLWGIIRKPTLKT